MSKKIEEIEGIGPAFKQKLNDAGIKTVDALLEKGCSKIGRKSICESTGIDDKRILRWVNMADLFRINGVGEEYADLLEAAGVDTVKELRNRIPSNLHAKMIEVNESKKLVRSVPSLSSVEKWINHAKNLEPKVTF